MSLVCSLQDRVSAPSSLSSPSPLDAHGQQGPPAPHLAGLFPESLDPCLAVLVWRAGDTQGQDPCFISRLKEPGAWAAAAHPEEWAGTKLAPGSQAEVAQ